MQGLSSNLSRPPHVESREALGQAQGVAVSHRFALFFIKRDSGTNCESITLYCACYSRLISYDSPYSNIMGTVLVEQAPDIKKMEGTIRTLYRNGKVDMAFMVMISMNLQRVS